MTSGRLKTKTLREMQIMGDKKDRFPQNPVDSVGERIAEIEGLGEIGKNIFNHFESMLFNNGVLDTPDSLSFFMLCEIWERWYNKMRECKEKGDYQDVKNYKGEVIGQQTAPWIKQERELWNALKQSLNDFGLSPVSRRNVEKIARNKEKNIFEGLT